MEERCDLNLMRFFDYKHLPEHLQKVSKPFHDLARVICDAWISREIDDISEATAGMRKLLEAKDCIVRAHLK